jgi:hypothetical protein
MLDFPFFRQETCMCKQQLIQVPMVQQIVKELQEL